MPSWGLHDLRRDGKNDAISRALIMVHGQGRDANNYFRHAFGAAFLAQSLGNTVIIAPRFASNREGNCRDTLSENKLNWSSHSRRKVGELVGTL